jgi:hypothetical protein
MLVTSEWHIWTSAPLVLFVGLPEGNRRVIQTVFAPG